jgi:PilZ domain
MEVDRLRDFSIVTMSLPDLGRVSEFKAYVVGVHRRVATLQPVERVEAMWLPPLIEDVLMCFPHNGQIVGLKGDLRGGERGDLIQFRVSDGVYLPRRQSSRLKLCAPAMLTPLASDGRPDGEEIACQTQDIGADGVTLEGVADLRADQLVALTVTLPEDAEAVTVQARVTGLHAGLSSLEFIGIERGTRRRVTAFVIEQLRRRLSIVRSLQEEQDDDWD